MQLVQVNDGLEAKSAELEDTVTDLTRQLSQKSGELDRLQASLGEGQEALQHQAAERARMEAKIAEQAAEIERLTKQLADSEQREEALTGQIADLKDRLDHARSVNSATHMHALVAWLPHAGLPLLCCAVWCNPRRVPHRCRMRCKSTRPKSKSWKRRLQRGEPQRQN